MTSRDFTYWLQGFFELSEVKTLTDEQVKIIKTHLNMVFVHDIDVIEVRESKLPKELLDRLHRGVDFKTTGVERTLKTSGVEATLKTSGVEAKINC